jgi:hypothetical protein
MTTTIAKIFGAIFVLVGILGFVPAATQNGHLLGVFHVNTVHNIIHLLSGLMALWVGFTGLHASKLFFRIFGAVYGLVAILGFVYGDRDILGLIASNMADTWLHVGIAAVSLFLGFAPETTARPTHVEARP